MNSHLRYMLIAVISALIWPISSAVASPNLLFQNYSSDAGLPNRGISSFAQDRNGSVWVGTDEGICMFDGESFVTPVFLQQEPFQSVTGRGMCIDSRNVLWLTSKEGTLNYNLDTGESHLFKEHRASQIACDGNGVVWMRCDQGLLRYNAETGDWDPSFAGAFTPVNICISTSGELCATAEDGCIYIKKKGQGSFSRIQILSSADNGLTLVNITACDERRLLYSTSDNSSYCLDLQSGRSRKIFDGHLDGNDAILTGILARNPQQFWMTTDNGLFIYDEDGGACTRYANHIGNPYSLASSKLRCIFKDSQDRLWLGTFYDGVSRFVDTGSGIRLFRVCPEDPEHSLGGKTVRSISVGDNGTVWAATEDGFLEKIHPDGRIFSFGYEDALRSKTYQSIVYSDGKVYAVSLGEGMSVYDSESLKLVKNYSVGNNYCNRLLSTTKGETLVGTAIGLYRYDGGSDSYVRMDSIPEAFVSALCEDRHGRIWVSVLSHGVFVLDTSGDNATRLGISDDADISSFRITDLFEDRDGRMWAATGGNGLFILKLDGDGLSKTSYTRISRSDGLPSNLCSGITQDKTGRMWISTMSGIVSIEDDAVADVTECKSIGNCFCPGSIMNSPDGIIYMGSSDGMVAFNPENIPERKHSIFLADIIKTKDNSFTSVSESGHSPFTSESIRIHSRETSSLMIRVRCFKTDMNEVVSYRYSLTGKGRDVISISNEKQVTYANLTPGRYSFKVNVNRDETPEACATLQIRVVPPFYASLLAKILYALLVFAGIFSVLFFKFTLIRKEKERAMERLESYKQKEAYESKINFFTNISHEIRTPLTLIKVPLDKIMGSKSYLPEAEYDMKCIQNSTDRLLDITEQILDFRKMENGTAKLSFSQTDLTKLVGDICSRMEVLAKEYSVTLNSILPDKAISIMCAPSSVDKIVSNLLMNGIKYCSSEVSIKLEEIPGDAVRISVMSDGTPIAPEEREKIFEPFYQSSKTQSRLSMNEGTGLGLSFARSLASLHNGTLAMDPAYEGGNSFVLELPVGQGVEQMEPEEETSSMGEEQDSSRNAILIVEDDPTLNDYIKTELSNEYTVYQAYNGKQALALLNEKGVSLIVSDVMMPEMDGCELVEVVKNTLKFSHIPIILLTAVTDYDTQLESLHSGADSYITKPFSMQILRATIFNILKNREVLFERFSSMPYTKPENVTNSQDDEFMKHLYDYVMENISNQDLSVLDLAEKMNASRSTLFRKIKANTGLNINEYIRVCRLKKAAELLSTQKYQTKEVAYMVGFTSLSYFTKSFQKQFNISPSSLLKKN